LLGEIKASAPTALQDLNLGGNLISSVAQGMGLFPSLSHPHIETV